MRIKNFIISIAAGAMLLGSLAACGGTKEEATTAAATEAATEADDQGRTSTDGAFISFNGVDLSIGTTFADVSDKLGTEVKPSETIEPCDGGDYIQIMHFYDGLTVTTLRDETIVSMELPESGSIEPLLAGKLKKGDQVEEVKRILGQPDNEDEFMVSYSIGNASVMIYLEEGKISRFMFMKAM